MKSFHEPIDVTLGADGLPRTWHWRRQLWRVLRVLDRWVLQARWWSDDTGRSGERRDYLLVEAAAESDEPCAVEIYWRADSDLWILARLLP